MAEELAMDDVQRDIQEKEAGYGARLNRLRKQARDKKAAAKSGTMKKGVSGAGAKSLGGINAGAVTAGAKKAAKQLKSGSVLGAIKTLRTTGVAVGADYVKWIAWGGVLSPLFWIALPYLTLHMILSMMGSKTFVMSWLERGAVLVIDLIFAGLVIGLIVLIVFLVDGLTGGVLGVFEF